MDRRHRGIWKKKRKDIKQNDNNGERWRIIEKMTERINWTHNRHPLGYEGAEEEEFLMSYDGIIGWKFIKLWTFNLFENIC